MFGHFDNQAHAALVKKEFKHCECHASPSPRVLTAFCRVRRRLISADVAILLLHPIDATSRGSLCSKYYGRNQRPSTQPSTPATRHVSNPLFSNFFFCSFRSLPVFLSFLFPRVAESERWLRAQPTLYMHWQPDSHPPAAACQAQLSPDFFNAHSHARCMIAATLSHLCLTPLAHPCPSAHPPFTLAPRRKRDAR